MIYFEHIIILWLVMQFKNILFWLYLWQLKNYYTPRLLAHFDTYQGKQLISGTQYKARFLMVGMLVLALLIGNLSATAGMEVLENILTFISYYYLILGLYSLYSLVFGKAKRPIFNLKIIVLLFASVIAFLIFSDYVFEFIGKHFLIYGGELGSLPIIDLLFPFVISFVVLLFQPITFIWQRIMMFLATQKRLSKKDLKVIAITGSYGKSTTKELIAHILSSKYKVCKTDKNNNSEVGISKCILSDLKDQDVFVCEMGAYTKGGVKMLCDIVKPKIGVLTGINEQHQATFGSLENIISTKFEIACGETLIANCNNEIVRSNIDKYNLKKICIGRDVKAENIQLEKEMISFDIIYNNERHNISINQPCGNSLIDNVLLSVATTLEMGLTMNEVLESLRSYNYNVSCSLEKSKSGINIIKSTYSSNPTGVISALKYFSIFDGKKVLIMPCLIELGESAGKIHYKIGKEAGKICDMIIVTSLDYYKKIKKGAVESGMLPGRVVYLNMGVVKTTKTFLNGSGNVMLEGRSSQQIIDNINNV